METKQLDPITFEILCHRLEAIVSEMGYMMARVSGNATVFECGDHNEAILDADGETVMLGGGIVDWVYSLETGGKHLVKEYQENPGIYDGDQFILTNAYLGPRHNGDVQLLAPVFWEGKRVAWAVSASHQSDLGGMAPSSISFEATETYQEGLQIPGLKIVEGEMLRKDVEEMLRAMVRIPDAFMLDISSKIAANNVGKARLLEMINRYGIGTVLTLFDQAKSYSEQKVRARLQNIPDGRYRAVHYVEGVREPYLKVDVTLIKEGDSLTVDFTGTSPQSAGPQNVAAPAAKGSAMGSYLLMLCHDIPWTGGLFRPVKFILPEGSAVNPRWPAPTCCNTPGGMGYTTVAATQEAVGKMLLAGEEMREQAYANSGASNQVYILFGLNHDGSYFVSLPMDGLASGMGGSPTRDGDDTCANMWTPKTQIANIETNELFMPILYITRREVCDTGGAGKFRGGVTILGAYMPWDAPLKEISGIDINHGIQIRTGSGLAGGYPPPNNQVRIIRDSNILEKFRRGEFPIDYDDIEGRVELMPALHFNPRIGERDVVFCYNSGGGGYGDPIERDPELVLRDVKLGYVSLAAAKDIYGVIVETKTGELDRVETERQRQRIIEERLKVGKK